jgi:hypothetical protein
MQCLNGCGKWVERGEWAGRCKECYDAWMRHLENPPERNATLMRAFARLYHDSAAMLYADWLTLGSSTERQSHGERPPAAPSFTVFRAWVKAGTPGLERVRAEAEHEQKQVEDQDPLRW